MGRRYGSLWHVHSMALLIVRENVQSSREGWRKDHQIKGKIVNELFKQKEESKSNSARLRCGLRERTRGEKGVCLIYRYTR